MRVASRSMQLPSMALARGVTVSVPITVIFSAAQPCMNVHRTFPIQTSTLHLRRINVFII